MSLPDTIKSRLVSSIAGVTVHFTRNDEMDISYLLLKRTGSKTKIVHSAVGITSFDELVKSLGKGTPVWISVTGRPVISRKLENDPGSRYLSHILPNAREEDFLVNVIQTRQSAVFISAVRYQQFEQLSTAIKESGLPVLGYSLGVAPLSFLGQVNLITDSRLAVPGYSLQFDSGSLLEIQTSEIQEDHKYRVGDEELDGKLLLPFAMALSYLVIHSGIDLATIDSFTSDEESFTLKKLNRYVAFSAMGALFIVLLINFFMFSHFNGKLQSLSGELSYQRVYFSQRDSLQKEITLKTSLVNQMGLAHNTEYGYYIDRIASTVPSSITLNALFVNPVLEKIKVNQPVIYEKNIVVQGESNGSIILNDWIDSMQNFNWIEDIEIIRYEKVDRNSEFELKILY